MTRTALAMIEAHDGGLKAVTRSLSERALARAALIDAAIARGEDPGPFAGVPFGVKDLFDVEGQSTTAGAAMRRDAPAALRDAEAIGRLQASGAILVATLNMDEFAYGFATINAAFGTTRNPHDPARLAGGSSGGSAAAVAAGMLPLTLGSDTNGSIRVPAGLCGVYGLKPTHGGLPMDGVFPFVDSFDDIGPFATSVGDLRLAWEILGGSAAEAIAAPRVATLGGWFGRNVAPELGQAIAQIGEALGGIPTVELPNVDVARSAAFLMTAVEGGTRHLPELRTRAREFDPQTRDRLIAGALMPGSAYRAAERFRDWFRVQAERLFETHDVLIAPSAGVEAPLIADPMIDIDGARVPARAHLGIHTQPISFIGLPVIAAPMLRPGKLPLGIQLIGRPGAEATLFAIAETLEAAGLTGFAPPEM
ncbi:AtzE family amidohydrolase [Sphingomonas sp. MMS12-HWE2-04]|uniref:AtzE family amidohydrolase n=1 Tax=Sphingomonas sp. MMS12-HWE2-04 TaxID=3234199 RepID=UPI00384BBB92